PHDQPDRDHDHSAEQEVLPHPAYRIEAHVPDHANEPLEAEQDVPWIEAERSQDHADHDRQEDQPHRHRNRRTAEKTTHEIHHRLPDCGPVSSTPSMCCKFSSRSASRGGLSQRSRLIRGKRIAKPDLWRDERCSPSKATSNTRPCSRSCTTSRTGPNRSTV